jgi:hypothetical protein
VEYLSGALLQGRLPYLPLNIRLGWKGLSETNNVAFLSRASIKAKEKSLKTFLSGAVAIKLFSSSLTEDSK